MGYLVNVLESACFDEFFQLKIYRCAALAVLILFAILSIP